MSERLDFARRQLELSEATEGSDGIEGRFGRQPVKLVAGEGEQCLEVECGAIPIERLCLRTAEPNDPDVVFTGDRVFDGTVLLLGRDGQGPRCSKLFAAAELRAQARELFRLFPGAELSGGSLRVPHLPLDAEVTTLALTTATSFVRELTAAWSRLDDLPALEQAPVLPSVEPKVRLRRLTSMAIRAAMGAAGGALIAFVFGWTGPGPLLLSAIGGGVLGLITTKAP